MRQPERFSLAGRHAFITGAARGIGFETALALGESGASIVISDMDKPLVDQAIARLRDKGVVAQGVTLDITDSAQCEAMAREFNSNGRQIDILVANAGIAWPDTAAEDMSDEAWLKVIDTNLNGTFWTCRAFGRHMVAREHGSIVTVGSMSGVISNKPQRQVHYNASKAAVHHL